TVGLDQVLTRISGDNWQWTVRNGSKPVVSQQVEIKFAADGSILTIDGSTNKSKTATISWGTDGSTQQKFDLEQVFKDTQAREIKAIQVNWFDGKKTATNVITPSLELNKNQALADPDFFSKVVTQSINNPNKAVYSPSVNDPDGQPTAVKNTFVKGTGDTWTWTVKNGASTLLEKDVDLTFNPDGTLATIDGVAATTATETLDWGAQGTTNTTINLQEIFEKSTEKSEVVLKQTLTRVSGDNWQWQITKGTDILKTENIDLTFNDDGTLATINGEYTTSREATLNYGSYVGDVEQSFDLGAVLKRGDFTQLIRVTDNIGVDRNVRIDYSRTGHPENRWQAKIWYEDGGKLAATVDFRFDNNGKIIGVGKYDADTGNIVGEDGRQSQKTFDFKIDWQRNQGYSQLTLDFEKIFSNGSVNIESGKTKTDSVELGKRKGVDIDLDGNVVATYAKADGTGDIKVNLYRLMVNTFDQPNLLRTDEKTGFFTAGAAAGNVNLRPLGTDKDFFGNALDGFAGQLGKPAKTTESKTVLEIVANGYNQNIFEQALGEENIALRYAVYFKNNASKIENVYNVLGDRALRDVFSTVFNIPERVATQSLAAQEAVFSRKIDFKKFQDPKFVDQFIQRFLAMSKNSQGTQASGYQSSLLSGGDAGSLLNLVGQNLNVLT
ncbi:MAG TPA: hypothetical protein DIS76_01385, partial [Rhodospirillaceae bacterium]|nr:hypothetical protein [Rhodospirillaceae bacterium]